MKEMLYAVRCLKSNEDMILAMTSLEPLRNSQRDFSSSVTLKYIMLQSRGLRADTRSVNEVMLRRIAVIKSSVVFNL